MLGLFGKGFEVKRENKACPLCGVLSDKVLSEKGRFKIFSCPQCRLYYLNAIPTAEELQKVYNNEYYLNATEPFGVESKRATYAPVAEQISRSLNKGKVLEIGCGTGVFLELLKERGLEPYGTEISDFALKMAQEKFPGKIFRSFPPVGFDAIVMLDVIEHIDDPRGYVDECRCRLNAAKGRLYIVTPDTLSLSAKLMGSRWAHISIPEHIHCFSHKAIRQLLTEKGFKIIDLKVFKKQICFYYAAHICKRYSRLPVDFVFRFLNQFLPSRIKNELCMIPTGEMIVEAQVI